MTRINWVKESENAQKRSEKKVEIDDEALELSDQTYTKVALDEDQDQIMNGDSVSLESSESDVLIESNKQIEV